MGIKVRLCRNRVFQLALIICLAAIAIAMSLPGTFSSGPVWPDGQRYVFNGILLHDLVRDGAIFDPYKYNVQFYAHFPATNLPYGPPLFALMMASVFSVAGISFSVARCVVVVFTALAAIMCFALFEARGKNRWTAGLTAAAFLFNPITVIYSRDVTPEVPVVFFSFLTLYFFWRYVEEERKWFGIMGAVAFSLGYLTKPYIAPLGMCVPWYLIVMRKWWVFRRKETWIALLIIIVAVVPYTIIGLHYSGAEVFKRGPISWELLWFFPVRIFQQDPLLSLVSLLGCVLGLIKRDKLVIFCVLWGTCWYAFFTFYVRVTGIEKYLVTLIPSILGPFEFFVRQFVWRVRRYHLNKAFVVGAIMLFALRAWGAPSWYVRGYEEAGKYVAENQRGRSVLFYGSYDGAFMLGVRKHTRQEIYVLRGDRQLATRYWWGELEDPGSILAKDDVCKLLQRWETGYVVVEQSMPLALKWEEYNRLLELIKSDERFREVGRWPIETNYRELGPELIVYSFDYGEKRRQKAEELKIRVSALENSLAAEF